ncbi:MAG TPA: carotenoid biosynthesis protein [Candidatus Limnocylindrales bacterium]|nr:carotenoid biosynthesis protein [Candidatus Limnocylindrales bacterium]
MPLRKQRKVFSEAIIALCLHWLLTVVFAAAFVLVVVMLFKPLKLPGIPGWPELLLLASGVACTITALTQRLPLQNVLLSVFIIAVLGGAAHALGAITGIPFGPFEFGESIGPQVFKTLPWAVPLIWVLAILNARGVARLILRPWRKISAYGFWLIGVTAALTLLFDFALEPFASRVKHYWLWTPTKFPVTWQGAPVSNFLAWAAVSVLLSVVIAPALINKQPGKKNTPDFHPFAIWLGAILLFATGCAQDGLLSAAVADGVLAGIVTVFAIRGGTW